MLYLSDNEGEVELANGGRRSLRDPCLETPLLVCKGREGIGISRAGPLPKTNCHLGKWPCPPRSKSDLEKTTLNIVSFSVI